MIDEAFYQDAGGKLQFRAIESVGVTNAVSFADYFCWRTNGYPSGKPTGMGRGIIWEAYDAEQKKALKK